MKFNLEIYQQLQAISEDTSFTDMDKSLFSICAVYGLTEQQLDNMRPDKVLKMANYVAKRFSKQIELKEPNYIDLYRINYKIENITFGQYIELVYFTRNNDVINKAHLIVATMANTFINTEHTNKANYFYKHCKANIVIGAANKIKSAFDAFNVTKFRALYEPYPEMQSDSGKMADWFSTNFGWFFSAESVAKFEGITLEQAYSLPVTKALNDLMFLKAKSRYEYYLAHLKN